MKTFALVIVGLALATAAPTAAQQAPAGLKGDMLAQFDEAATKLVQLAEAIPPEKYGWRPGPGVRSVSEVVMHVGMGDYLILGFAGVTSPVQLTRGLETSMTQKAQVIDFLKKANDHTRAAIRAVPDAHLDKPTQMFGQQTTYRNAYMTLVTHAHEHLGQLIAYARTNGIVPPWSMAGGD
ncbi:MAG: DinB family protein [Gemmatimonadales bacterium]